jgi:hypothetical protein
LWDVAVKDDQYSGGLQLRYSGGGPQVLFKTNGEVNILGNTKIGGAAGDVPITRLDIAAVDGTNEGGEIHLRGAGSNRDWGMDVYTSSFRIFSTNNGSGAGLVSRLIINDTVGNIEIPGHEMYFGTSASTQAVAIELGHSRSGNGAALIDLHASSGTDYEARLIRNSGANGDAVLTNKGTGTLFIIQESTGDIALHNNGSNSLVTYNGGAVRVPYIGTTGSSANAFFDGGDGNNCLRSTSSVVYKEQIEDIEPERINSFFEKARPIWFKSKAPADVLSDGTCKSFYHFSAEALAEIDPRLVNWGYWPEDYETIGKERKLKADAVLRPDGINHGGIIALLCAKVQQIESALLCPGD